MNLLIVGPQASGKGTQTEKLIDRFGLTHVEMGGILRTISRQDTDLGKEVSGFINNGLLVPDDIIIKVINAYLQNLGESHGTLFDGFPRVISQAQYFEQYLAQKGQKLDLVIYLTLPREEVFKRLSNRRTCSACGKVFNILTKPSKKEGVCDFCGSELIIRQDETPEKINKRLDEFDTKTMPMIRYFQAKGLVEEFDGNRPIDDIFNAIVESLKEHGLV